MERACKRRRAHVLRSVSDRCLTRHGPPARANPQGQHSGGNPGAATHEVRARHQPENSAAAWACDSAIAACPRRRGHRVTLAVILLHLRDRSWHGPESDRFYGRMEAISVAIIPQGWQI